MALTKEQERELKRDFEEMGKINEQAIRKSEREKCEKRGCPKCGYPLIPRKGYRHVFCPNCELKERNSAWVKLDIENLKLRKRLERMKKKLKKLKEGL